LLEPTGDEVLTASAGDAVTDAVTDEVTDPVTFGSGSRADQVRRTGQPMLLPLGGDLDDVGPTGTELWQPVVVEGQVIAVLQVGWNSVLSGMEDRAVAAVRVLVDEAGASLHAVQLRTELERFAATDPLTGALNRRAWAVQLQVLMEQSKVRAAPLTIALVDLDHFKAFNDANGHAAGDDLLREFAATVLGRLRSTDLFARWGGEEFVVALADCDEDRAAAMLHRVREAVPDGQSCSIGHTIWEPDETMAACIGRADSALYRAKGSGRNRLAHL
jgi:diguanylate cyclase (GGDEF)-like protein